MSEKRMFAVFSEEAYEAYKRGEAVDNNGFRSRKGFFYPDQPSFEPINSRKEQVKDELAVLAIVAVTKIVTDTVLPEIDHLVKTKVRPFVEEKWDEMVERHNEKKNKRSEKGSAENNDDSASEECNVIKFEDYRKMA